MPRSEIEPSQYVYPYPQFATAFQEFLEAVEANIPSIEKSILFGTWELSELPSHKKKKTTPE